mmetsp:Transcript_26670/g.59648  ORF Transcript_26670/g.59648 Transcript_26670/m.59648 type:complete len:370 (-) Transcript_26670:194-1303(-)
MPPHPHSHTKTTHHDVLLFALIRFSSRFPHKNSEFPEAAPCDAQHSPPGELRHGGDFEARGALFVVPGAAENRLEHGLEHGPKRVERSGTHSLFQVPRNLTRRRKGGLAPGSGDSHARLFKLDAHLARFHLDGMLELRTNPGFTHAWEKDWWCRQRNLYEIVQRSLGDVLEHRAQFGAAATRCPGEALAHHALCIRPFAGERRRVDEPPAADERVDKLGALEVARRQLFQAADFRVDLANVGTSCRRATVKTRTQYNEVRCDLRDAFRLGTFLLISRLGLFFFSRFGRRKLFFLSRLDRSLCPKLFLFSRLGRRLLFGRIGHCRILCRDLFLFNRLGRRLILCGFRFFHLFQLHFGLRRFFYLLCLFGS